MNPLPRLLYLSGLQDFPDSASFEIHLRTLLDSGLPWYQFRDKRLEDGTLFRWAEKIRRWTAETGCILTINDRPDIALLTGADGVHLGQEDLSALEQEFRRPHDGFHLGLSTHSPAAVRRAILVGPDYLGVGPIFPTSTKDTVIAPRGIAGLTETRNMTSVPLVAIGGVTVDTVRELLSSGASSIAVSGALTKSVRPAETLRAFLALTLSP